MSYPAVHPTRYFLMSYIAQEIELAVANFFDWRRNLIVPNVSWGLFLHECDLLILTPTGYAYEVEIKVSKEDIRRDAKKRHGHWSKKIRKLYFAIPEKLLEYQELIPDHAGIIYINAKYGSAYKAREAKVNPASFKFNNDDIEKLKHLGLMRTWKLRRKIQELSKTIKEMECQQTTA